MYAEAEERTSPGLWARVEAALLAQRGRLLLWVPICMGLGIGAYFALKVEPALADYLGVAGVAAVAALAARWAPEPVSPLAMALVFVALGFLLAGARAHRVGDPILTFRYYGPIEGRIVAMDRSASDKLRLTLDQVILARMDPAKTPGRVRISLHGQQGFITPEPGMTVILTGHLSPPGGPVEPGGFDFARHAWFLGLGAVGYTRTPCSDARTAATRQFGAPPVSAAHGPSQAASRSAWATGPVEWPLQS